MSVHPFLLSYSRQCFCLPLRPGPGGGRLELPFHINPDEAGEEGVLVFSHQASWLEKSRNGALRLLLGLESLLSSLWQSSLKPSFPVRTRFLWPAGGQGPHRTLSKPPWVPRMCGVECKEISKNSLSPSDTIRNNRKY